MMIRKSTLFPALVIFSIIYAVTANAELSPLPQPLTLDAALGYAADRSSPELAAIYSKEMMLLAEHDSLQASDSAQVSLDGQLQWAEPVVTPDSWVDNHKASLILQKNLYDFGRTESYQAANKMVLNALQSELVSVQWQRREYIMSCFFDVLLADHTADRNEEEMAGAFIRFDRIRERQRLGQASDLEVLKKESRYQQVFLRRNRGISQQRVTRSLLAAALNREGELPENLVKPELPTTTLPLPEPEVIAKRALAGNRALESITQKIAAARQDISAVSRERLPQIDGEIELADTTRLTSQSDRWRVGLKIFMPIYDGGRNNALLAKARAKVYRLEADRSALVSKIRQQVLTEWSNLNHLKQQESAARIELEYRDLYLDNSRADYELEFKTDLGNAMVKISEAQLNLEKNRYQQALTWERLDALTNAGMAVLSAQAVMAKSATEGGE